MRHGLCAKGLGGFHPCASAPLVCYGALLLWLIDKVCVLASLLRDISDGWHESPSLIATGEICCMFIYQAYSQPLAYTKLVVDAPHLWRCSRTDEGVNKL